MILNAQTIVFAPVEDVIKSLDSSQFDLVYIDPPFFTGTDFYGDDRLVGKTFKEYLEYVVFVIHQSRRLLRDTGAVLFRMDPLSPFNSRLFLDRIFGKQNLRAEVIWEFAGRRITSRLPRANFDTVYFYSRSDKFTYHEPVVALSEHELRLRYPHKDERGFYKYWSLIAPIDRPNMRFAWKGFTPPKGSAWKYSQAKLDEFERNGEIEMHRNNPRRKVYLTESTTETSMGFVWKDFKPIRPDDNRIDPKIQSIVRMTSNPYDFVFDPFMLPRSGPSIQSVDRKWAGVALIKDDTVYKAPGIVLQTLTSDFVSSLAEVDTSKLPKHILRTIDAESKSLDADPSLFYTGQRYALLVGINNYRDGIPTLNYCVNDVKGIEETLKIAEYTVVTIHDEQEDDNLLPLQANIVTELENLAQNLGPEDTLFVHFSCHGAVIDNCVTLITSDTRRQKLLKTSLQLEEIIAAMKSGPAQKLVLSLDVCHAGVDTGRAIIDQEFVDNVYNNAEGLALLAASTARQTASEPSELQHGLFSYYLIQGLNGDADLDDDGRITVTDIRTFTLNSIRAWNLKHQQKQDPTFQFQGVGEILLISPISS